LARAAPPADSSSPRRGGGLKVIIDNLEELVAVVLLMLIGVSMATQVFLRSFFGAPLSWPEELSQFLFVWASILGAVGAGKRLGLVRVETVVEKLPAGARNALEKLILIGIGILLAVLGWQGSQMAARSTYAATTLPITWAWMYSAAAVFAVLMYARLLQAQLFKYRFTFLETVISAKRP
jgi:TRAP-type C4-dicarboxylate transport system permease small subunit